MANSRTHAPPIGAIAIQYLWRTPHKGMKQWLRAVTQWSDVVDLKNPAFERWLCKVGRAGRPSVAKSDFLRDDENPYFLQSVLVFILSIFIFKTGHEP